MTQATDTDIREIKDLIAANTKAIADLTLEMRLGFASVDTKLSDIKGEIKQVETQLEGKIDKLDGKITTLTTNVSNLDGRLWGFGGTILAAVLAALLTIFGRYIFAGLPIIQP
jgi:chaperonin cofactor prefoldin